MTDLVPFIDKRLHARSKTSAMTVVVYHDKKRIIGHMINLSPGGALLHVEGSGLVKNDIFDLTIIVKLNNSNLTKVYYKQAVVEHITAGNIGVSIGNRPKRT